MERIELHYRKVILSERIRQIQAEVEVLVEKTLASPLWYERARLLIASSHLMTAADELDKTSELKEAK